MAIALSDLSAVTKKLYYAKKLNEIQILNSPFFSMLRKEGDWVGDDTFNVPAVYGRGQGVSATFARAQANVSSSKHKRYALSTATKYGVCKLEAKAIHFTKGNGSQLTQAIVHEVDAVRRQVQSDIARDLYGTGGGAIGKRSSISGNIVTLVTADDCRNFFIGMTVRASANEDGTSPRAGRTAVDAIDWENGKVTLNDETQITSFANNDYLFRDGDEALTLTGLGSPYDSASKKGWIPNAAPTSGDSHFGVDRSTNVVPLCGWRVTDTTLPLEEAMIEAGARAKRLDANVDAIFANPLTVGNLMKKAGSKVFRDEGGGATLGFTGITAAIPTGICKVFADAYCPPKRVYGIDMSTCALKWAGPSLIHFTDEDGLTWARSATADEFESRMRMWGNLYFTAPGKNFVIITA